MPHTQEPHLHCQIADLLVDIPATPDLSRRCQAYLTDDPAAATIRLRADRYQLDAWPGLSRDDAIYMESGGQFYHALLSCGGMMLHASAVAMGGRAYLFSGPCGAGKSTHTRLWQRVYGSAAQVFNDDKPALRLRDGRWYAYGTPWCGKDGINLNQKWPLGGICFLEQGRENRIQRLTSAQALPLLISQTVYLLYQQDMDRLLVGLDRLVREVPIFRLVNRPEEAAARLSFTTMRHGLEEKEHETEN